MGGWWPQILRPGGGEMRDRTEDILDAAIERRARQLVVSEGLAPAAALEAATQELGPVEPGRVELDADAGDG